jgi:hypothetical protein
MSNAAFYFGLVRALVHDERPLWSQMSFSAAEENFHVAAQHGIDASLYWPSLGSVPATELILRRLLPLAHRGLDTAGVDPAIRDRLLGVIEQRCLTGRNGATWLSQAFHARFDADAGDRFAALRAVMDDYRQLMHSNDPVHSWPLA